MRYSLACALFGALLSNTAAAQASEGAAPPLVTNERQGYAFEFPRVLAQQRLFGLAHGVALLANTCSTDPVNAEAAAKAYATWYEQQHIQLDELHNELATFYYGPRAAEASWAHIAATLKLREQLDLSEEQRNAACASLPEALQQSRYDLTGLFQLEGAIAETALATRIESHVAACLSRLPENEREGLSTRFAEWQRNEGEAINSAQERLLHYWQLTASTGTAAEWQQLLRERYAKPSTAICTHLDALLQSPEASLANRFAPAPLITPPVETADHAVSAVSHTTPQDTTPAAATETAVEEDPPQEFNLFDTLMRLFDERPHENQGSNRKPARSQRAYP